ncbi:MAG TPA: hypothetical protein VHU23_17220 [Rhizomicrobium sp.]|jgi:hypothetical protein|nr:hypothetical protein [Rhizomicrobium sp.]
MTTGDSAQSRPLVSLKFIIGVVLIGMLSFFAFLALFAYAPEFRDDNDGGAHALSGSAIGFAGLRVFLYDAGIRTAIDRGTLHKYSVPSLAVLTPGPDTSGSELYALDHLEPRLVVLPKWVPVGDPLMRGRVMKAGMFGTRDVAKLLNSFSSTSQIRRERGTAAPKLKVARSGSGIVVPDKLQPVDSLQTLEGRDWIPIVVSAHGGVVLARLHHSLTYVLADPDFMNTHGLHDLATAGMALAIVRDIRIGHGPIGFDVTLNGFRRMPNLLRDIFAPPFLGATLCAILAALLLAVHAASRFGSPAAPARVFALGKLALVDNTAQLIRMMHREPRMAARYAQAMRNLVVQAVGLRRDAQDTQRLIWALERDRGATYDELFAAARDVKNNSELMKSAGELFRWRQRMTHGTK